jgi:hypothetical protein
MAQFQQDPGYNFQQQQGQAGINASAAAKGMSMSPATAEALSTFNQGLASTSYQQSFNNYMTQEQFALNQQQSLAQVGQSAVNSANYLGGQNAANQGANIIGAGNASANGIIGAGNATAAGQVGSANALGGALSGISNNFLTAGMYQSMFGQNTGNTAASFMPAATSGAAAGGLGVSTAGATDIGSSFADLAATIA